MNDLPAYLLINKLTGSKELLMGEQVNDWWDKQLGFSLELRNKYKLLYLGIMNPKVAEILYGRGTP